MEGEMEGLVVEKNMQEKLRDLVRYGDELRKLEQQLGRFNLFAVLGTTHQELKHSNILAWLFNPAEGHGLGDAMLRAWLMAVYEFIDGETDKDAEQLKIDPVDVDTTTFRSVQVYREWNRVDLLIKIDTVEQGEWIVAVENKIESKQGQSQLKRYGEKIDTGFPKHSKVLKLFLTKHLEEPNDQAWFPVNYRTISNALENAISAFEGRILDGPKFLIKQYLTVIKVHFMENTKDIELAVRIYLRHKDALEFIYENRPNVVNEALMRIEKRIDESEELIFISRKNNLINFHPKSWENNNNIGGAGLPVIYYILNLKDAKFVLAAKLTEDLSGKAPREIIFGLSKSHKFANKNGKNKPPDGLYTFYKEESRDVNFEESDADTLANEIWDLFCKKINGDKYVNVRDAIAEHLDAILSPDSSE